MALMMIATEPLMKGLRTSTRAAVVVRRRGNSAMVETTTVTGLSELNVSADQALALDVAADCASCTERWVSGCETCPQRVVAAKGVTGEDLLIADLGVRHDRWADTEPLE